MITKFNDFLHETKTYNLSTSVNTDAPISEDDTVYAVGDKVYSYLNPTKPAPIVDADNNKYKLTLTNKDGDTYTTDWIDKEYLDIKPDRYVKNTDDGSIGPPNPYWRDDEKNAELLKHMPMLHPRNNGEVQSGDEAKITHDGLYNVGDKVYSYLNSEPAPVTATDFIDDHIVYKLKIDGEETDWIPENELSFDPINNVLPESVVLSDNEQTVLKRIYESKHQAGEGEEVIDYPIPLFVKIEGINETNSIVSDLIQKGLVDTEGGDKNKIIWLTLSGYTTGTKYELF